MIFSRHRLPTRLSCQSLPEPVNQQASLVDTNTFLSNVA